MLPYEAFKAVLDKYKISQQQIVEESGVGKGVVSRFINGVSDMKAQNLQKLVQALPPQAKAYYYMLFAYSDENPKNIKIGEKSNEYKV